MNRTVETDVAIIGGGITGLWLLNRLRQAGYSAMLLESGTLGGGQTHKSQGILHGGMKYALQGALTASSHGVADAPAVWRDCLAGTGCIDLRAVPILSPTQYLWTGGSVLARVGGFVASKILQTQAHPLARDAFPDIFHHAAFRGDVYAFDEQVIDVHALVGELARWQPGVIFHTNPLAATDLHYRSSGEIDHITLHTGSLDPVTLRAERFIFAAGAGNEALLKRAGSDDAKMQRRPLHMVLARHSFPWDVYAHCLGTGATPRLTITTHNTRANKKIWYLGGQIAEEGIDRSPEEQVMMARAELQSLFPWLDFAGVDFASFFVDRAEAKQPGLKRPDSFSVEATANYFVAWPTKLVLAPLLAEAMLEKLSGTPIKTGKEDIEALQAWPVPALAQPIWEKLF